MLLYGALLDGYKAYSKSKDLTIIKKHQLIKEDTFLHIINTKCCV